PPFPAGGYRALPHFAAASGDGYDDYRRGSRRRHVRHGYHGCRERSRRRNDDKRQAQQEVKALNREEQPVQETEQEERVQQVQP
ncbi:hypothetical protein ONO39_27920, partial [Salmonella enterica subsp. enterica serovar Anatum]|nr:hypothetical protein [Salmonella enterica subsp. enterica serovar Anatum]